MSGEVQKSGLSTLLSLESRARAAGDAHALFFVMVNETIRLIPYRRALLWNRATGRIAAVSGTPSFDPETPFGQWAEGVCAELGRGADELRELSAKELPEKYAADWAEWFPSGALWLPLVRPDGDSPGALLFGRERPWTEQEKTLLTFLAGTYSHAWLALGGRTLQRRRKGGRRWLLLVPLLCLLGLVPVRLTALGQAEVLPQNPAILRSPLDGIIDEVLVEANAPVTAGEPLVNLDVQDLENRLLMAKKGREVEKVRLLQASQLALRDRSRSGEVAVIKASIAEKDAEVAWLQEMLSRAVLSAPFDGVAIFNDKSELAGRPVHTGERILSVARPTSSRLVVWLSTRDAINLAPGAPIRLFLNTAPDTPVAATLARASFSASPRPGGFMAYRLEAEFDAESAPPRIGLQGVAKIYGERTTLAYYLLRRPLTVLRQWLGV